MIAHWDVHPVRVNVFPCQAYRFIISDNVMVTLLRSHVPVIQRAAGRPQISNPRTITLYYVQAELNTWASDSVTRCSDLTAPELYTLSKAVALIVAGRLVERLKCRDRIRSLDSLYDEVYGLAEEMGADIEKRPAHIDLDELLRKDRQKALDES